MQAKNKRGTDKRFLCFFFFFYKEEVCLSYSLLSSPSVSRCRLFGGAGGGSSRSLLVKVCSIRVVTVVTVSMKTFSCTWGIPVTDTSSVTWKPNRCLESMSYKKLMCININT